MKPHSRKQDNPPGKRDPVKGMVNKRNEYLWSVDGRRIEETILPLDLTIWAIVWYKHLKNSGDPYGTSTFDTSIAGAVLLPTEL